MKKMIAVLTVCLCVFMLAACGGGSSSDSSSSGGKASAYTVLTVDESGAPVEGVSLQFCSGDMCQMGETGKDGKAVFEVEEGRYTVHVFQAPDGYAEDSTEYELPESYGEVTITLKPAE